MARISYMQALLLLVCFVLLACCSLHPCNAHQTCHNAKRHMKKFKGMFVFGTSVVDNGNNNYINDTLSKVNYLPYGIDFPYGATGRYTNGKNVADTIAHFFGLPFIPPFADPRTKGHKIRHGVNYGSGGSGILDETGSIAGGVINLNQQIRNFVEVTLPELKKLITEHKAAKKLDRYLFVIAEGNNDFQLNYFLQDNSSRPSLPVFVANLSSTYSTQLQRLYNVGARKFALLTVYPIGCSPVTKQRANSTRCVQIVNAAARYFNTQLIKLVHGLKQKLPNSEFVVVNTYNIIENITKNPVPKGFRNVTGSCCELDDVGVLCKEGGNVCRNRNSYVYFDAQHNTEAVNWVIAEKAFSSHNKSEVLSFQPSKIGSALNVCFSFLGSF